MITVQIKTRLGSSISLAEETLTTLQGQLRGALLRAGDTGYEEARKVWNGSIDHRPALIVRCLGAADVMAAVNFAREHRLLISTRAGGHNVAGTAIVEGGMVIDVSQMRSVQVDPQKRIARVEGGARLGDLDHETTAFGLAAPVGVVSETGVAGLTLHGGAGWLLRKHGLSIDNLEAIELVTADGRLVRASAAEHADLFWALRGGGGNFGVATVFEFRLHPIAPQVSIVLPIYPIDRGHEVLLACRDYLATAPDELMVLGVYWSAPAIPEVAEQYHGQPVVFLVGCYSGPPEQAERVIAPLRTIAAPLADLSSTLPWRQAQRILDEDYPDGKFYYWKSIYLDRLDDEVLGVLEQFARSRPSAASSIDIWFLGGAMSRVAPTATAFANRHQKFMIGIEANWSERNDSQANIAWARALHQALQPFSSGGNYLNFPGYVEDPAAMLRGAYGENLERLMRVKTTYDPDNLFPGLLNIAPK